MDARARAAKRTTADHRDDRCRGRASFARSRRRSREFFRARRSRFARDMSPPRSTRARGGAFGAFGDVELHAVAPGGLNDVSNPSDGDAASRGVARAGAGSSTFFALVFLGNPPEDRAATGTLLLHLRKESTRVLVLTPANAIVSPEPGADGGTDAPPAERSLEEHSRRLVASLLPDFALDHVRSTSGRSIMVVDRETWIILLGVEPWQFGVYGLRANDINEAGGGVLDDACKPRFSLRDTAPLFNFTKKRRVDELRRDVRHRRAATPEDASAERISETSNPVDATLDVDQVMELVGLTEDAMDEQPSAKLLRARARRKERKKHKKAARRERAALEMEADDVGSTPATATEDISVGTVENSNPNPNPRDARSRPLGAESRGVVDIEDIVARPRLAPAASASMNSSCTVRCGECAYASACDRKRKLEDVIRSTSYEGEEGCAFAYCSNVDADEDGALSRLVSSAAKRRRRVVAATTETATRREAADDWVVVGKKGRAIRDEEDDAEDGEEDRLMRPRRSVAGPVARESPAAASSEASLRRALASAEALRDENRRLKAELRARKQNADALTLKLARAERRLAMALPSPRSPGASAEEVARGAAILSSVHHWFSADNLSRDAFLRARMDPNGFVPLRTLCAFPSLARLSVTARELASLLKSSPLVHLDAMGEACRCAAAARAYPAG